jgi:hypothetical protein
MDEPRGAAGNPIAASPALLVTQRFPVNMRRSQTAARRVYNRGTNRTSRSTPQASLLAGTTMAAVPIYMPVDPAIGVQTNVSMGLTI